jgi:predicted kinase
MKLLMILGSPASGKTTLARRLAAASALPLLCKDDVKEALFDVLGVCDRTASRRLSEASFAAQLRLARTQLESGVSCLVEGNFRAAHAAALHDLLEATGGALGQVWCRAPAQELLRRFRERVRHPGHLDGSTPDEELQRHAQASPAFLDLAGPRWIFDSDAPGAYAVLRNQVDSWRL